MSKILFKTGVKFVYNEILPVLNKNNCTSPFYGM